MDVSEARGTAEAEGLLEAFARRTGLVGETPARRYLWTDAFAVCTLLGLHRATGEERFLKRALALVEQVHRVLGRHRSDDARTGWISGLSEEEGAAHPTLGGLRIGKDRPERGPGEPLDERLEWDRDGQYFHYLTKWMHALHRVSRVTGEAAYHRQAVELAVAAHVAFTADSDRRSSEPPRPCRFAWKMSIDLARPLVPSMGQHDPLDAYVTDLELLDDGSDSQLERALAEAAATCRVMRWQTVDPLGAGGLLVDASRLAARLARDGRTRPPLLEPIARDVLVDAMVSLEAVVRSGMLDQPLRHRLPFRDLGMSIGLHAVERAEGTLASTDEGAGLLEAARRHAGVARRIEDDWSAPASQRLETWHDHEDINAVTLATSLCPEGYLGA